MARGGTSQIVVAELLVAKLTEHGLPQTVIELFAFFIAAVKPSALICS